MAAELADDLRRALVALMDVLRGQTATGDVRWARPESIHLTLRFLGEVVASRLPALAVRLSILARAGSPFALHPAGLGTFGGRGGPRVVWIGVEGDLRALLALAAGVEEAAGASGFPKGKRPFSAHLTLGRVADRVPAAARAGLARRIEASAAGPMPRLDVTTMALMRSILTPSGSRYETMERYRLGGS